LFVDNNGDTVASSADYFAWALIGAIRLVVLLYQHQHYGFVYKGLYAVGIPRVVALKLQCHENLLTGNFRITVLNLLTDAILSLLQ
jgi:hypothetical protein